MMSNRVIHFEIPSDNPEANMKFFKEVFDWNFEQMEDRPYWFAISGDEKSPGINGAIMQKVEPGQPLINTISVVNLDEAIKKIEQAGGQIVKPKMTIPSIGWLAFFLDRDGHCHGILQEDQQAK